LRPRLLATVSFVKLVVEPYHTEAIIEVMVVAQYQEMVYIPLVESYITPLRSPPSIAT
jgi:hypothetical protein